MTNTILSKSQNTPTLPNGDVTFLFTALEGTAKLWQQQPAAMQQAVTQHDAIIHEAAQLHHGYIFQSLAETVCLAFTDPADAVATALDIQRGFHDHDWDSDMALNVKIALNRGPAMLQAGQYFAPQTLNRLSRILAIAHPGQILLSQVVVDALGGRLPANITLRDMGERQLRDIQPVRVYQLGVNDLPADFPPLRSLDARPTNLPAQASSFVGRQQEQVEIASLLRQPDVQLVTLLGPGGSGKTRLSIQVAANLLDELDDGAFFVPLAAISDPTLVPSVIAQHLGVAEQAGQSLLDTLKAYQADKRMLLVLDNFEQIIAAAPLIAELLASAPKLKLLISSREPLHLPQEREYQVPSLGLPDLAHLPELERLSDYAAVQLFVQRAQAAKLDFTLEQSNAADVAAICVKLDGLPLAIELAAARIRMLPPHEMLKRLNNRLALLVGNNRDRTARQQSLRGMIDWSYDLLDVGEQLLFVRLAVFVGGCTVEAAAAICNVGGDLPIDVAEGLVSLANKSLLLEIPTTLPAATSEDGQDGSLLRFAMLETIREYALEKLSMGVAQRFSIAQKALREYAQKKLSESGEERELRAQHASYYLNLAQIGQRELQGPQQNRWLDILEQEHDNLRTALAWAIAQPMAAIASALVVALHRFWYWRNHLREGCDWAMRSLAISSDNDAQRANVLVVAGDLAYRIGNWRDSVVHLEECLQIRRQLGDERGIADALNALANSRYDGGEYQTAQRIYEECVRIYERLGDLRGVAIALGNMGIIASDAEDYASARRLYEQALSIKRQIGASQQSIATTRGNLAFVLHQLGDYPAAHALYNEILDVFAESKNRDGAAFALEGLAMLTADANQPDRALTLFAAATALRQEIGSPIPPADIERVEGIIAFTRAQVGEQATQVWASGQTMSFAAMIDYARDTKIT